MTPVRLLVPIIHLAAILTMSATAAYVFSTSFVFERWLADLLQSTLEWEKAAGARVLFGGFVFGGVLLSFLGHRPGLFALLLVPFLLPAVYAQSWLQWLEFAGLDVEAGLSANRVGVLGIVLMASYLSIRMGLWLANEERDLRQRKARVSDVQGVYMFSFAVLIVSIGIAAGLGLSLVYVLKSEQGLLGGVFGRVPFEVLIIGISSVVMMAWVIGRLITGQTLISQDLWRWRHKSL